MQEAQVQFLLTELRSHMLWGMAKKIQQTKNPKPTKTGEGTESRKIEIEAKEVHLLFSGYLISSV